MSRDVFAGYDLALDYDSVQTRPLPLLASIRIGEVGDPVDAVIPLCGGEGGGGGAGEGGNFAPMAMGAVVATADGFVHTVDLQMALSQAGDGQSLLAHWDAPPHSVACGGGGQSALATVPVANAIVAAWRIEVEDIVSGGDRGCGCLSILDLRQTAPAAILGPNDGCPAIVSLFAPPELSIPSVLAATTTGLLYLVDLRMLRSPGDWLVAMDDSVGGGRPQWLGGSSMLAGDAQTLLVARHDGALLSVFDRRGGQRRIARASAGLRVVAAAATVTAGGGGEYERHEEAGEGQEAWEDSFTKKKVLSKKEKKKKKVGEKAKAQGRRQTTGKQGGRSKGSR
jgi:hypothetical protein